MKKIIGAVLATALLSTAAVASAQNLMTNNKANIASTVMINGAQDACATTLDSNAFTPANTKKPTAWTSVKNICWLANFPLNPRFPCHATVYVGKNHNCSGTEIATVTLAANGMVTVNKELDSAEYTVTGGNYLTTITPVK